MTIRVLNEETISRIAAGEVVERPASVVKELVENALDAGATQLSVEAKDGGVSLIRVTDNGCGIPAGEVELAFRRYATSKISSLVDLTSSRSLGFRGEALSSIVAVAEVELVTRTGSEPDGTYLVLRDGAVVEHSRQGRAQGTTVTVKHLFRRVPARLKFLKSRATESSHIASIVSHYALAFPEVRFTLSQDGRIILRTPGSGRLLDSINQVYGLEIAQHMLEVKARDGSGRDEVGVPSVTGMIGSPKVSRASRDYLSLFINRRWVNHRLLSWAVEEAYHGLLMVGKHPVAVVNIALPPGEVDVNVHPTKIEVRLRDERAIVASVQKAVRSTLVELTPVPRIEEVATGKREFPEFPPGLWAVSARLGSDVATRPPASSESMVPPAKALPVLRVVGQLLTSYIVAEGPEGIYVIDQHAAHERILFEQIKAKQQFRKLEVQTLLEPVPFEVSPKQSAILTTKLESLAEFGFAIEPFGERTFLVRAVPALLAERNWSEVLRDLLDSSREQADWVERVAVTMACHSAVRAGQVMTDPEMRAMIKELEQVSLPHSCPHGRPTMIYLSLNQLNSEFGRT
jgi:DNA mismatch repair protein MutL